jgi:hypothetical protein
VPLRPCYHQAPDRLHPHQTITTLGGLLCRPLTSTVGTTCRVVRLILENRKKKKLSSIGAAGDKAFPSAKAMMATRWWPLGSGAASLRISVPRRRSRRNQATSVTTKYHLSILHVHHQQISLFPCNRRNSPRSISSSIADYCL